LYRSFQDIRNDLFSGAITCERLVASYLDNIAGKAHLNAFVQVYNREALDRARHVDKKLSDGTAGVLAGMVVALRDLICHADHPLEAFSRILTGYVSPFSATAVHKLLKEDAIVIGRVNCDEFGMGSSNEHSAYGPVLNSIDDRYVPGGSSGGSAVAVQAGLCTASLGTDTGGSVRQPASFCGVVGCKPTYSRISRYGLVAYASSFDTIGIITNTVEDNTLLLQVMADHFGEGALYSFSDWYLRQRGAA
jgi:aspartyl-tRNA(Asn)/glutamyl-tRNA(Gln) amidotransferase subunit A